MIQYSISDLARGSANRPRGTVVKLSPIEDRLGTVVSYTRILKAMLRRIANEVRSQIIPAYQSEREQKRVMRDGVATFQDVSREWFFALQALSTQLARTSDDMVERVLTLESERHTETFIKSARVALGIDISSVVRQEDLTEYLTAAATRNASLIKSLSEDIVKRVEQTVLQNSIQGNSVTTLRQQLTEQFGITGRRADLIAFDQTAKMNSDLNRIRHEQAGITEYDWLTSHDERVRPLHRGLDGKRYTYGKPTGAENGLPPGQPIRCRCVAQAVVTF